MKTLTISMVLLFSNCCIADTFTVSRSPTSYNARYGANYSYRFQNYKEYNTPVYASPNIFGGQNFSNGWQSRPNIFGGYNYYKRY